MAHGQPFNDYIAASIEMKPAPRGAWTAWLALVETVPVGTEGTAVERNLVRNLLQVPWNNARPAPRLFESRPMQLAEGTKGERLRVIHLVREDVFDQAISLHIASKTRQWASWLGQRATPPAYNAERLLTVAADLSAQNGAFRTLFQLWGITPCEVRYEALVADPASELARLGDFLGLPDLGFDPGEISCERQAGALNAEYKARLQRDFALTPGD